MTWPLAARAQHAERPTVGFLRSQSPDGYGPYANAFRQGSSDAGYAEGLVHRQVDAIAASGGVVTARAAMAATTSIPIVFTAVKTQCRRVS